MAIRYDCIVIGAGPGGYTAALKAAELGLKVAVIEKEKAGGTCVNRGCIPTKALLHASGIFHELQNCDKFGVSTDFISFDFGKMQKYKKKAVAEYRSEIEQLFEEAGVDMITGTASIRRGKHVDVRNADVYKRQSLTKTGRNFSREGRGEGADITTMIIPPIWRIFSKMIQKATGKAR